MLHMSLFNSAHTARLIIAKAYFMVESNTMRYFMLTHLLHSKFKLNWTFCLYWQKVCRSSFTHVSQTMNSLRSVKLVRAQSELTVEPSRDAPVTLGTIRSVSLLPSALRSLSAHLSGKEITSYFSPFHEPVMGTYQLLCLPLYFFGLNVKVAANTQ